MKMLAKIQNPLRSRTFFATLGKGIQRAMAYRRLIVSHLGEVSNPEQVSFVADFLVNYERVSWSFCTGRYKGSLHLSLRAKATAARAGDVLRDVVENRNEAGGHGTIAGGRCKVGKTASEEKWTELEQRLQSRLTKRLRIRTSGEFRRIFA
jgi:nanoRNase/pAp phosphatase (c-di-AMP/oligoRNAs hydrolase)